MKQLTSKLSELHKFEISCLRGKNWPILKIQKVLNSQDVKDSKRSKTSLISACFEAFLETVRFQFSTDFELNLLLALRGKTILVWISRTRFFTGFEVPALFSSLLSRESNKRARTSKSVKNRVLESYSNIFFTLAHWTKLTQIWRECIFWQ